MKRVTRAMLIGIMLASATVGFAEGESSRANIIRVNLGGLVVGPWIDTYGVDLAYERRISDWLGWNFSVWSLYSTEAMGLGAGTSVDWFPIGGALHGVFINARVGVVSGEIYSVPTMTVQTGFSVGLQSIWPGGLVFRVGSGGTYVFNSRFLPRILFSVGFAF
jgi:hypothetical protein